MGHSGHVRNCGKATSFYDLEVYVPLARDLKILYQVEGKVVPVLN
jgi:hypothetical protein